MARENDSAAHQPILHRGVRGLAIVLPSWIGDSVMATPVLRATRAALPNTRISGIVRPGIDDVLRGLPWLDEMIACRMKGVGGVLRLAGAIRRSGAEAVLLLPNSFRSALAARLSGARVCIGYQRDRRGWLLSHPVATPASAEPIPAVEYYIHLARAALGCAAIEPRVELRVTDEERLTATKLLDGVPQPFIVINPGANRADKRWPAVRFAAVADALAHARGLAAVVSGSPGERDVLDAVIRAAQTKVVNLAERGVTLGGLKGIIAQAALVITNDTGPRHLAAALGTPVVTLFGPTDHRWTTLAGGLAGERILLAEPFLPEELVADRHRKACAIEKISVGDVVEAAEQLLAPLAA